MYLHLNDTKIIIHHGLRPIIIFFPIWGLLCHLGLFNFIPIRQTWSNKRPLCYWFISTLTEFLKHYIITCIYYDLSAIYVALIEMLKHHAGLLCWRQVASNFHLLYCIKIDKGVLNTVATLLSVIAVGMLFHHYWDTLQRRR